MSRSKAIACTLSLVILTVLLSGCAGMNDRAEGVNFSRIGGFADRKGQARILIVTYSGQPKKTNIREYANSLGCGMIFVYYYPETVDKRSIPVSQLAAARNFSEAREVLFKGEKVAKWHFATQCLGIIPTLTDCRESPISTNCR